MENRARVAEGRKRPRRCYAYIDGVIRDDPGSGKGDHCEWPTYPHSALNHAGRFGVLGSQQRPEAMAALTRKMTTFRQIRRSAFTPYCILVSWQRASRWKPLAQYTQDCGCMRQVRRDYEPKIVFEWLANVRMVRWRDRNLNEKQGARSFNRNMDGFVKAKVHTILAHSRQSKTEKKDWVLTCSNRIRESDNTERSDNVGSSSRRAYNYLHLHSKRYTLPQ
ncbi:hypothetical protein FKP32DRAFT_182515 [Trametes sanguinea]|nr:hypothetical protein FKP32DRAFT_182515 [Trametes sanguinea]